MTVSNTNTSSTYNGNGSTRSWDLGFTYNGTLSGLSIKVTKADGTVINVTSDYSLYNGVLTYPTIASGRPPLTSSESITISRRTPLTQEINLTQQGPLDAETLESGYDKATMQIQETHREIQEVSAAKQDKLIAGDNIIIDENNRISASGPLSGSVPWGSITGTIANQADLNNSFVHKTGDTMTGYLTVNREGEHFVAKDSRLNRNTDPTDNTNGGYFTCTDANGSLFGRIYFSQLPSGAHRAQLSVASNEATDTSVSIGISMNKDGSNPHGFAPTPSDNSNTTHIATTAWARGQLVQKTGDTMTGLLVMDNNADTHVRFLLKDNDLDRDSTPSSGKTGDFIDLNDGSGDNVARILALNTAAGENQIQIEASDADSSDRARLGVSINKAGTTSYAYCPTPASSSNTNHIATTSWVRSLLADNQADGLASFSKSGDGYIKFSNGIIIQWGLSPEVANEQTGTISFPTPFTSTNYKITASAYNNPNASGSQGDYYYIDTYTTTACTLHAHFQYALCRVAWMAIGY